MNYDIFNIYLMMFHKGKKKAIIKQEENLVKFYFYNPYGYKGIAKVYGITDRIVFVGDILGKLK